MQRESLRPTLVACACVAVILGAGCGDDDSDETGSSPKTTSTTTATAPAEVTPLRRRLERELARQIAAGDGGVDADCVIEELRRTMPNDVVEAATDAAERGDEIPTEAVDAAYAAGRECAKQ